MTSTPCPLERAAPGELLVGDVARLRTLVDDLMEVSRFDAEAEQFAAQPVDLGRVLETVVAQPAAGGPADASAGTDRSSRRIRAGWSASSATSSTTPASTRPARRSTCRLEATDGAIVIAVEDRGPGVAADRLERIFDRFYKADPSRHGGSSGLGLAIAAEHAALLGGELRAMNRDGGGLQD